MSLLTIAITSFIIARLCISSGYRIGLVDHPDTRKHHDGAVPLTGGISIFLTVMFGTLFLDIAPFNNEMLAIAFAVFLVGVVDDIRHIHAGARLTVQFVAGAMLATYGGIAITNVGNLLGFGDIHLLALTIPLSALAVAGLSNAFNMIDGIDGLAASTITLPLGVLYLLAVQAGHPSADALLLMLVPLAVFLVFNLGPDNRQLPKMFLGDGGSVTLGFLVTASLVYLSQGENALINPVTALWLVTLPLMDMLATMLRRAKAGRKLMEADRSHLHHSLMDMGLSPRQTLVILVIYATASAVIGLLLEGLPEYVSLCCYFLVFFGHCLFVLKPDRVSPRMQSRHKQNTVSTQG